ncbi:conserved hypothetical protein [Ricinus communis]|uniref:Uncharacterized protein n=1 Tax=Ricinus communis TaxID=3988 RepID=B9TPD7_RICCO|nr:conserved hypothetical protein [Ricinus communis]
MAVVTCSKTQQPSAERERQDSDQGRSSKSWQGDTHMLVKAAAYQQHQWQGHRPFNGDQNQA